MDRSFGQELKRAAEEAGFATQQELADASGVSQGMIAKLYLDQRPNVSATVLFKLCAALGVDCNHFAPYLTEGEAGTGEDAGKAAAAKKPAGGKRPKGK